MLPASLTALIWEASNSGEQQRCAHFAVEAFRGNTFVDEVLKGLGEDQTARVLFRETFAEVGALGKRR